MFLMLLVSALIVGMSLGLLGAGGSILTVPALMLLLEMTEKTAIASSLAIVALIAFTGVLSAIKHKTLQPKILFWFVVSSLPAAAIGAYLGTLFANGVQTVLLTIVMLLAAKKMFSSSPIRPLDQIQIPKLLFAGALTGLVTGLVGVGGGFLIVPALVIYAGLTMQQAIANSLLLIALNASTAFVTLYFGPQMPAIDWTVIGVMAGVGSVAVIAGQTLANKLDQKLLKRVFASLLVLVALSLLINLFLF
jgi:hypothetical protein